MFLTWQNKDYWLSMVTQVFPGPVQTNLAPILEGEDLPGVVDGGQGVPHHAGQHGLQPGLPAPECWSADMWSATAGYRVIKPVLLPHYGQPLQQVVEEGALLAVQPWVAYYNRSAGERKLLKKIKQ